METVITYDAAGAYSTIKMFKDIYVKLKLANNIYLSSTEDGIIDVAFSNDSGFYLTFGKLHFKNLLSKILLDNKCTISMTLEQLMTIGRMKKKDFVNITETKTYIAIGYLADNDSGSQSLTLEILKKVDSDAVPKNDFIFKYDEPLENIDEDLCLYYLDENNKITTEKTDDRLIEIPTGSLKILLPDGENFIKFTDPNTDGNRIVCIGSKTNAIELYKIFKTI